MLLQDHEGIEQLWKDLSGALRAFIRRRAPEADVEDILQESFVKIHGGMKGLKDQTKLTAWVYQIVRNTIVDTLRRRKITEPVDDDLPASPDSNDANLNRTIGRCLAGMVDHLPAAYRDAVTLIEIQGLPQKAAAEKLGLSLSGAKSRAQRGRKMLKEALARCCHVEFDRRGGAIDYKPIRKTCCR